MRTLILLLAASCLAGCMSAEHTLKKQVAFDEKCPQEKVQVLAWGPGQRSAKVDACGKPLSYHAEVYGMTDTTPGFMNWVQVR